MKTILLLITLCLMPFMAYAQKTDGVYYSPNEANKGKAPRTIQQGFATYIISPADNAELTAKIQHLQVCINRYHSQRRSAYILQGISLGVMGIAVANDDADTRQVLSVLGGATSLISLVVFIDAEKWLKRASIEPTREGLTFKFNF